MIAATLGVGRSDGARTGVAIRRVPDTGVSRRDLGDSSTGLLSDLFALMAFFQYAQTMPADFVEAFRGSSADNTDRGGR